MEYIIFIARWVIRLVFILMVASFFIGMIYVFAFEASKDEDGNHSCKAFILNILSVIDDIVKLFVAGVVLYLFAWCCSFITKPPCVNLVTETGEGSFWLSDSSMVCDSNDSTAYYTVKSVSKTGTPGRFTHCIRCGRIYKLHTRWLTEDERRLRQIIDEINSETATGLLVDPL